MALITFRNISVFLHLFYFWQLQSHSRYRETAKLNDLPTNIPVEDVVFDAIQESIIGDTVSIADFIRKYGSHYIASYITGNSLYQVRYGLFTVAIGYMEMKEYLNADALGFAFRFISIIPIYLMAAVLYKYNNFTVKQTGSNFHFSFLK